MIVNLKHKMQLRVQNPFFLVVFGEGLFFFLFFSFFSCATAASKGNQMNVYSSESIANRDVTFRDTRLLRMKTTRSAIKFPPFFSQQQWQKRAGELRKHILISAGLWPFPPKTPLHAHIFGKIKHPDYSVEKVYFESYPNFFVTGNLYRPLGKSGPFPAILTPHGHWKHGRLENSETASVPGRCINFARQGYVVFSYDMVGFCDSKQISHKFAQDRLSQALGINLLGLQLWDSIRSLDFLESLPDVDTTRIGCTGASGGGTQTFLLTAVDPRVKVAAPVNMVSAHFQGGCLCENAPGLRLNASNVEFAAMAAPRPLLLVSDTHDWTKNTPWVEYPMVKKVYDLLGAGEKIHYVQFDFPHNYNKASREAVYAWFGKWLLKKTNPENLKERPFAVDPSSALSVFPNGRPPGHLTADTLKANLIRLAAQQLAEFWPKDSLSLRQFQKIYGTALREILAAHRPEHVVFHPVGGWQGENYLLRKLLIARKGKFDWIPAIFVEPAHSYGSAVLVVSGKGKGSLFSPRSQDLSKWIRFLLHKGVAVLAIDPFGVGEHILLKGTKTERDEKVNYFTTYNRTKVQEQVQDVLTSTVALEKLSGVNKIGLIGLGKGGPVALLSASLEKNFQKILVDATALEAKKKNLLLSYFVPGLGRIGDFTTAAAFISPQPLTIYGCSSKTALDVNRIRQVYHLHKGENQFRVLEGKLTSGRIQREF